MPRSGGGVYSLPAGSIVTDGVDNILAAQHNDPLNDIALDMNTARPVVAGGTGATTAAGARTALGLAIGTDVQAFDVGLASIAGLTTAADRMLYTTALDVYAVATLTAAGRAILDDADAAAQRVTLGLAIGTDVQAYDADLAAIAALADPNADRILFWDDSAGAMAFLEPGPGLIVSGTTLTSAIQWQTAVATTSGDNLSLSAAIPATASRLIVSLRGVSLNGGNNILVQLGTSGGFVTTGYVSSCGIAGPSTAGALSTSGILVLAGDAGRTVSGSVTLDKVSGNLWSASVCCGDGIENVIGGGGYIDLGGAATQIRISTDGANAFDAGAASAGWQ